MAAPEKSENLPTAVERHTLCNDRFLTTHTMKDDSPTPSPENFTVFEFALMQALHGIPRQSVKLVGEFACIEEAFEVSLARARREAAQLAESYANLSTALNAEPSVTILATEWGYDVRHENQTVTRYWIHPRPGMTD